MKRTMRFICLLLAVFTASGMLHAQNNVYGIDDDLYKILVYANENVNSGRGLIAADSLYRAAEAAGDGKSMCLALTIPMRHYSAEFNRDSMVYYADKVAEQARETNNLQYYYFAKTNTVVFDINTGRMREAVDGANEVWDMAFNVDTVAFGRYSAMQVLGHVYIGLYDQDLALKQYKDALDYMQNHVVGQDPSGLASRICELYLDKGELDSAMVYCDYALKNARTQRVQMLALMLRSRILFQCGDMDAFGKAYRHAFDRVINKDVVADSMSIYLFMIDRAKADGDKRVALQYASRIKPRAVSREATARVYEYFGDYDKALYETRKMQAIIDSSRSNLLLDQMSIRGQGVLDPKMHQGALMRNDSDSAGRRFWMILFVVLAVLCVIGAIIALMQIRHSHKLMHTRLEEADERANESRIAAEMAEKVRATTYVQTVGRNMRNPLNAIVGFSQLLSDTDSYLPEDLRKRYSGIIRANSNLLMALVDDMTDLSELESQMKEVTLATVSPNVVVREAIAMFEARAYDTGRTALSLDFDTEIPDDYTIMSDAAHLRQVVNQLLSNAEKFTNNLDGGMIKVNISLSENLGHLTISVTDTGIGIPADKAETIFEKFVKLNKSVPGNGLGLTIARMIITHLDGEVYLDTSYTDGARFVVLLPVDE